MTITSLESAHGRRGGRVEHETLDGLRDEMDALLEVAKGIASRINQLERRPVALPSTNTHPGAEPRSRDMLANTARAAIERLRSQPDFGAPALFANRMWLLVLELFVADRGGVSISVKQAASTIEGPQTTALRKLLALEQNGIVQSSDCLEDGRRRLVRLSPQADAMVADHLRMIAGSEGSPPSIRLRVRQTHVVEGDGSANGVVVDRHIEPKSVRAISGSNQVLQS